MQMAWKFKWWRVSPVACNLWHDDHITLSILDPSIFESAQGF